jgi:DNA-binding XRE family transcriptional regulator
LPNYSKVNIIIRNNKKGVVIISTDNPLRLLREKLLISRSELARRASLSVMTLQRIETGKPCRIDTKRKIVKALGFNPWMNKQRASVSE